MPYDINETHDPNLKSWIESANEPATDFPIQNLPLCTTSSSEEYDRDRQDYCWNGHVCVAIGDQIMDLSRGVIARAILDELASDERGSVYDQLVFHVGDAGEDPIWPSRLRLALSRFLREGNSRAQEIVATYGAMKPAIGGSLEFWTPQVVYFDIQNYTDFYASLHHATNVGSMFRPDNALLPNYKHIPIGYHGRASSIVVSGTEITRPRGQQAPPDNDAKAGPSFGPCRMLDYELEVGAVIARGNGLGTPIPIGEAEDHIFGLCLVNDWSARDIQKWEYQPLGPFLAKNFATTISPYIVTMEALAPFRAPAFKRPDGDPKPLPYLHSDRDQAHGAFDITLEVHLASKQMRDRAMPPVRLSKGNFKDMYWTFAQLVAHHASGGCNLQPGDLLASGTVSGPTRGSRGCLLELTWDGDPWASPPKIVPGTQRTPIRLPTGEERRFLEDGDEVILKGYCEREGFRRIGFGECRGIVRPARG